MKRFDRSMHDIEKDFYDFMTQMGIKPLTDYPRADGQLHRYRVEGDRAGSKNGWFVLYSHPYPFGACGSWKQGSSHTWNGQDGTGLPPATDMGKIKRQIAAAAKKHKREVERRQLAVAEVCRQQWATFPEANECHPYLQTKGVKPHGLKQKDGSLIIPLRDTSGELFSWQRIGPDGRKMFQKEGRTKGCFHQINDIHPGRTTIFIAEGYATAATIYERMPEVMDNFVNKSLLPNASDYAVIVAFNASNLTCVAQAIRAQYKLNPIVIVADNDHRTEGNPGETKAKEAQLLCNAQLIMPTFEPHETGTDFNDFFQNQGMVKL